MSNIKTSKKENAIDSNKNPNFNDFKNRKASPKKSKGLKSKEMNFLEKYEIIVEQKPPRINPKLYIISSVSVIIIILAATIILNVFLSIEKNNNKVIKEYIDNENNIARYSESVKLTEEIDKRQKAKNEIDNVLNSIDGYPQLNEQFVDMLFGTAGQKKVKVNSINYGSEHGSIIISCECKSVDDVPVFVKALRDTEIFEAVTYKGYSGCDKSQYSFTVTCVCKGTN